MFKRLYWQGYQGRFGSFRWPTKYNFPAMGYDAQAYDLNNFDKSEWQAWKSGAPLRTLVTELNQKYPGEVRVSAHSMGNIVVGEALRINETNTPLVAIYAALEAAIPSHSYDPDAATRTIPSIREDNTPNVYANYWQTSSSNYFHGYRGAETYVNFYNPVDYALEKWEFNQDFRPANSIQYYYDLGVFNKGLAHTPLSLPEDTYEIFSFGVEARCYALGAQAGVEGPFDSAIEILLDPEPFSFGDTRDGHSGQYKFTITRTWLFWDELLKTFELKPR